MQKEKKEKRESDQKASIEGIRETLFSLRDEGYRSFQSKLIPTVDPERIIGVRTPTLRFFAKTISKETASAFLRDLPHRYFDEDQLHAFLLSDRKEFSDCLSGVKAFLPFVNNWATCDQLCPKVFKRNKAALLPEIEKWIDSEKEYERRFGIKMLMDGFLEEDFDPSFLERVARVRSEAYYVKMMVAWFFATALAKQYDATIPYIENHLLDPWCHGRAVQKAIESFRIPEKKKEYLRSLRRK